MAWQFGAARKCCKQMLGGLVMNRSAAQHALAVWCCTQVLILWRGNFGWHTSAAKITEYVVYVYVYVFLCFCVYVCICVCVYRCTFACVYVCM